MIFETRLTLVGRHAFLSPSNYHWTNYDEDKLIRVYNQNLASERGVRLHDLAQNLIKEKVKLPNNNQTLNLYVNDAIGFQMTPEPTLYYSDNCFGRPDAISFDVEKAMLRIHDLKTGINEASMRQLEVYAALFCLQYGYNPLQIQIELRIYQNGEVKIYVPDVDDIFHIIDRIKTFDKRINYLKSEGLL